MRNDAGFSLLEVLLATLLLGVTLVGLTEAMTVSLKSSKESEQHTLAVLLAESRMEEIRTEGSLFAGETTGEFDSYPNYTYIETIEETELDGLYRVMVSVQHVAMDRKLYTLETLIFELPLEVDNGSNVSTTGDGIEGGR